MNFRLTKWESFALLLCAAIGALSIPFPFHGDQAMFMMAASKLSSEGMLYRDFWDFKQPGIYWFFTTGGRLFGFTEIGVHTLECLYMLLGSLAILMVLRRRLSNPWIAACAAVMLPVWYYGIATDWHRTQVEALVGVPLLICVAVFSNSVEGEQRARWSGFGAGICSAVTLIFKLALLPLATGPILIYLAYQRHARRRFSRPLVIFYVLGLILPLSATVLYFVAGGAGREAFDANFLYPGNLIREYPPASHFMRIRGALFWFLRSFSPLVVLAALGVILRPNRKNGLLTVQLWYWLSMGTLVIWVQWYSHWGYHFFLLFVPVLVLAAFGLDRLCTALTQANKAPAGLIRAGVVSVALLLSVTPVLTILRRSVVLAKKGFAVSPLGRAEYYATQSTIGYGSIHKEAEFLREPASLPGQLLVIGNPLYYTVSGRVQAGVENGWAPDLMLARNRQQVVSDLREHPAAYVLIEGEFETGIVQERFKDLRDVLETRYEVYRSNPFKVWYRSRPPVIR